MIELMLDARTQCLGNTLSYIQYRSIDTPPRCTVLCTFRHFVLCNTVIWTNDRMRVDDHTRHTVSGDYRFGFFEWSSQTASVDASGPVFRSPNL